MNKNKDALERTIAEEREKVNGTKEVIKMMVINVEEEKIIKTLEENIKKIFLGGRKMEVRSSPLQMLTDIESRINRSLKWMRDYEDKGEEMHVKMEKKQKEIDRYNRAAKREEKAKLE